MKQTLLCTLACLLLASCDKSETPAPPFVIEGITTENFPRLDGSTSALPLQSILTCELLGIDWTWERRLAYDGIYYVCPDYDQTPGDFHDRFSASGTHEAYVNLIDGTKDLILVARAPSQDELSRAAQAGVALEKVPVALDAFVFIVNAEKTVNGLTIEQIRDIYSAKITNWKTVGGRDAEIIPYIRDENSGSQELMESLVMQGQKMSDWPLAMLTGMMGPFMEVGQNNNSLSYSVYYFKEMIVRYDNVKSLSVSGVYPDKKNIADRKYPLVAEVYAVIRADEPAGSMTRRIFDGLQTDAGRGVVDKSGYIPYKGETRKAL